MKMSSQRRALDKIYKRRDRYEVPEWQRDEVWDLSKKQQLIDSILRGWRLPKFYFVKTSEESYEVVDGQQRLATIYEFFGNELALPAESQKEFGGPYYKDLKSKYSDAFDDFEIDYDEIEDASEEDLKKFFLRLQQGLPLNSSEKLNAVHSKLRDYCKTLSKHDFFKKSLLLPDTRYAHFDIVAKAAVLEVEGVDAGLRFDDVLPVFESQKSFSPTSAVAKRLKSALDLLLSAFPTPTGLLKNRTVVQSAITLACRLVGTGKAKGLEGKLASFLKHFVAELTHQVELGQAATDHDYIRFQKSVNANVKAGPRTRQEILLRKALMYDPALAAAFDPDAIKESGINGRIKELSQEISTEITTKNTAYSAIHGIDLFKATTKTVSALGNLGKPIADFNGYKTLIENLYFLFRESVGSRLEANIPVSFGDVNSLRTHLDHDVDHGEEKKIKAKKKKFGDTFEKYAGHKSPETLDPAGFVVVQAKLLSSLLQDLKGLNVAALKKTVP